MVIVPKTAHRYNRVDSEQHINRSLRENEVPINPFWLCVADKDGNFVGELAQLTFKALRDVYDKTFGMGFYSPNDNQLIERGLVFYGTNGRADAGSGSDLDDNYARLVGVRRVVVENAPEVADLSQERLASQTPVFSGNLESTVRNLMATHGVSADEFPKVFEHYAAIKKQK